MRATARPFICAATCLGVSICLLIPPLPILAQDSTTAEYRSKANFLATFPKFIQWPEEAFPSQESPFVLCVIGHYAFGTSLAEIERAASVQRRKLNVTWVRKVEELRTCHLLFVSGSERKRYDKILEAIRGTSVLTVGETPEFLEAGGAISLTYEEPAGTVRFEVSVAAANGARIRISSRLLAMARHVVNENETAKS